MAIFHSHVSYNFQNFGYAPPPPQLWLDIHSENTPK